MNDSSTPEAMTGRARSQRARRPVGLVLLGTATLASVGVIVWGVTGSAPATTATLDPVEAQFATVESGDLVESTRVTSTVSRGEIISLAIPESGGSPTGQTGQAGQAGATGAVAPVAAAPATTIPATTVPVTTAPAMTTTTVDPTGSTTTTPTTTPTTTVDPTSSTTPTTTTIVPTTAPMTVPTTAVPTTVPTSAMPPATVPAASARTASPTTAQTTAARVVTGVASVGTELAAGDTAFSIDGRPSVVVPGTVPAWRAIDADTGDGVDVQQLETWLASAGFDADGDLVVDEEVDAATVSAIEDWQDSIDVEATGRIELGEVVFLDGAVTVVAVNGRVGDVLEPGDNVMDVRTGTPYVDVSTDASWTTQAEVKVSLGTSTVTGTITSFASGIARVALPSTTTVRDGSEAVVTLSRTKVTGELLVPASAILRFDVAGPSVRVESDEGRHTVRVDVIASANGSAAIRPTNGDLVAGDRVDRY